MALQVEVPGDKIKTQKIEFGAFKGPSGQNHQYHTPLLFKILDLTENKKIVNNPFKDDIWLHLKDHTNRESHPDAECSSELRNESGRCVTS